MPAPNNFDIEAHITRPQLEELAKPDKASITDVKPLASYSWIERATPTIAVPGCPALWAPLKSPKKLEPDSGTVFIAQNAARHPSSPLEPLFRAVYETEPSFDPRPVDIFCDRNNLRKLHGFAAGRPDFPKPFAIRVEVVGNSLILCREEESTIQVIKPGEFVGFGHEFEKTYTRSQVKDSTGHHRIVNYQFCGLNLVIRSETDGYVDSPQDAKSPIKGVDGNDELADVMGSLSLKNEEIKPDGSVMTIQKKGRRVPLESTLEIKTRTIKKPIEVPDVAAQLWVSQTPKLVRAYHAGGRFIKTEVKDVNDEVKQWEKDKSEELKRLGSLLKWIVDVARSSAEQQFRIRYNIQSDLLLMFKSDAGPMLPADLYAKWGMNGEDKKSKEK